jgi:hypothetical protein
MLTRIFLNTLPEMASSVVFGGKVVDVVVVRGKVSVAGRLGLVGVLVESSSA